MSPPPVAAPRKLAADVVHHDASLRALNSFGLEARAARYFRATSAAAVKRALALEQPALVLGGGSNVLFTRDVDGLVLHVDIRGRRELRREGHEVIVEAGAGENWHEFVRYTLQAGLGGLENLSLIPGSVGATPVQNIGAYGVEIRDHFESLRAVARESLEEVEFDAADCAFGYRDSSFKRHGRNRYVITHVRFRLTADDHAHRLDYGDIRGALERSGATPSIAAISEAVIAIRRSKLPDPAEIGNGGSFFKNPELSAGEFESLRARRPDVRSYPLADGRVKVPAAWLIDQAGWKGHRRGAIGVHDRQALVLVNHGGGRGADLWALAREIQADVAEKFGVRLEPEVNVI